MICIDCGTEFEGNYCPKCGQSAKTKRITTMDTIRSIFVSFLMGDSKFMNTCLQLFIRPGVMVRNYLYGRRARLMAPVPMLVRLVAVYLLITFLTNTTIGSYHVVDESVKSHMHSETLIMFTDFISRIMSNSVLYSLLSAALFVVPFYLLFRKKTIERHDGSRLRLNMAEHFCALVYISCQNMLLALILLPLHDILWLRNIADIIFLILPIVMYRQIYQLSWFSSFWRCLLAWLMMIVAISLTVILTFGLFYGYDAVKA